MKRIVFCVVNWKNKTEALALKPILSEWCERVDYAIGDNVKFLCGGSQSDPHLNPTHLPFYQMNIDGDPYDIHFWKCGFFCGLYKALIDYSFSHLIYLQYNLLFDIDLEPYIEKFEQTDKTLCAPQLTYSTGTYIDNTLMIMKPDAVRKWMVESQINVRLENGHHENIEKEAYELFSDEWYNPFSFITTRRTMWKRMGRFSTFEEKFKLTSDQFVEQDVVLGYKHCEEYETELWKKYHPIRTRN